MNLVLPTIEQNSVCGQYCKMGCFVLASLLLHVLVVALWHGEPPAGPVGRSTFKITLVARHGDIPEKPGVEHEQAGESEPSPSSKSSALTGEQSKPVEDDKQQALLTTEPTVSLQSAARIVKQNTANETQPVKSVRKPQTNAPG